jgi:XTP/dITP diphosphohydrolase
VSRPHVLLATRSRGKLHELRPLFLECGIDVMDLEELGIDERPEEAGLEAFESFEENARAKSAFFHKLTGMPTVADDSGLEVLALGGRPGVRSKRWCNQPHLEGTALDEANNEQLLKELKGVEDRRARYVCVASYRDAERELLRRGEVQGRIVDVPRGTHGFGYDPHFVAEETGTTFGELTRREKQALSHRGRAVQALVQALLATG